MLHAFPKKILASLLLGAVVVPSFLFTEVKTAHAIGFSAASQGIVSAGIGCAADTIGRKIGGKISSYIGNEAVSKAGGIASVSTKDSATGENTKAVAFKETCLKKIARAASQVVLRELTKDTVAWINNGFDGNPFFPRNDKSFFQSIRDREIGGLAKTFSDKKKYPFGQSFIRGYVRSIQTGLER